MTEQSTRNFIGSTRGSAEPTWTIRVSSPEALDPAEMAQVLAPVNHGHGCTIERAIGVWGNEVEQALTITAQAGGFEVEKWLVAIAGSFPTLRWVHVERAEPEVEYVDLDELGKYYGNRS